MNFKFYKILLHSSISLSKLYLAFAGLVEGILWQLYFSNKSGKDFLKAEYDLFPFKQMV